MWFGFLVRRELTLPYFLLFMLFTTLVKVLIVAVRIYYGPVILKLLFCMSFIIGEQLKVFLMFSVFFVAFLVKFYVFFVTFFVTSYVFFVAFFVTFYVFFVKFSVFFVTFFVTLYVFFVKFSVFFLTLRELADSPQMPRNL